MRCPATITIDLKPQEEGDDEVIVTASIEGESVEAARLTVDDAGDYHVACVSSRRRVPRMATRTMRRIECAILEAL